MLQLDGNVDVYMMECNRMLKYNTSKIDHVFHVDIVIMEESRLSSVARYNRPATNHSVLVNPWFQ
jgi:hypothetical protein